MCVCVCWAVPTSQLQSPSHLAMGLLACCQLQLMAWLTSSPVLLPTVLFSGGPTSITGWPPLQCKALKNVETACLCCSSSSCSVTVCIPSFSRAAAVTSYLCRSSSQSLHCSFHLPLFLLSCKTPLLLRCSYHFVLCCNCLLFPDCSNLLSISCRSILSLCCGCPQFMICSLSQVPEQAAPHVVAFSTRVWMGVWMGESRLVHSPHAQFVSLWSLVLHCSHQILVLTFGLPITHVHCIALACSGITSSKLI